MRARNRQDAIVGDYYEPASVAGRRRRAAGDILPAVEDALMPEHNDFRIRGRASRPFVGMRAWCLPRARTRRIFCSSRQYFEHASPEGFTSVERVALLARSFIGLAGENIVEEENGPPASAADLAELWRNSPGHRQNMLRPSYTHIGIGVVRGGSRTIGAVAFGERFTELETPLAWRVGDGSALPDMLKTSGAPIRGYVLAPVGGGGRPWSLLARRPSKRTRAQRPLRPEALYG